MNKEELLAEEHICNGKCQDDITKNYVHCKTCTRLKDFLAGYNKANEWHYVKDGKLPRQDGHTCFSIEVLANNKKWVYYQFDSGKWFCGNKEVKVIAWKEIVLPELKESE